jgi:hypothetical protein
MNNTRMALVKFKGACGNDVMIDTNSIEIVYGIKLMGKDCTYVRLKSGKTIILADEMKRFIKKVAEAVSRVEGIVE